MDVPAPEVRWLGRREYQQTWRAMQAFTAGRTPASADEIWLLEHPPVYTQGLNGKAEHLLRDSAVPLVQSDRGGQITYHGPGQLVAYVLWDLQRAGFGVKTLVIKLEQALIDLLAALDIDAARRPGAPGVYVEEKKIAALGLRVRRGCCYHGLSLNVNMDLAPFADINPCGYPALAVTQLCEHSAIDDVSRAGELLPGYLLKHLLNAEHQSLAIPGS